MLFLTFMHAYLIFKCKVPVKRNTSSQYYRCQFCCREFLDAHHGLSILWTLCNSRKNFATEFVKIVWSIMFPQFLHAFQLSSTSAAIFILLSFHLSLIDKSVSNCYQFLTTWYNYLPLCTEISNTFKFDNIWWCPGSGTAHFWASNVNLFSYSGFYFLICMWYNTILLL